MSESDAERQADEIDSLTWIYPLELITTSITKPISGYFKISPHLIENEIIVRVETIANEIRNFSIRHLSPIELYFTLPVDYPSEAQPLFMVSCAWLAHDKLTNICRKLDDLWDKNYGCEILFLWVSFLKDDLLQFLNINDLSIKLDMDLKTKSLSNENITDMSTINDINPKNFKLRALTNKIAAAKNDKKNISASAVSYNFAKRSKLKTRHFAGENNFKYETPKDVEEKMIRESSSIKTSSKQDCGKEEKSRVAVSKTELIFRAISTYGKRPKMTVGEFDSRVVPNSGEQANILNHLVDYNEYRLDIEFRSETHMCNICFEEKPGWQCICIKPCRHAFCKNCVTDYLTVNIQSGLVQRLSCLNLDCETIFTKQLVKQNVTNATFTKYLEFSQKSMVQNDATLLFCPRKFCQSVAQVFDGRKMCHCQQCNFYFCYYCKKTYHGVDVCKIQSEEIVIVIEEYQKASEARKIELEKRFGKSQLVKWVQEDMTEKLLKEVSRPCPNCGSLIQKDEGCNKMLCTSCSVPFCWLCNTSLSLTHPYGHYQNRDSPCFEKLFSFSEDGLYDFEGVFDFGEGAIGFDVGAFDFEEGDDFDIIFSDNL